MPETSGAVVEVIDTKPSQRVHAPRKPGVRSVTLAAALGLFSRFGLHGTSVDQMAARADVSRSNLLYYFSNKEQLYVSVLRELLAVRVIEEVASGLIRSAGRLHRSRGVASGRTPCSHRHGRG